MTEEQISEASEDYSFNLDYGYMEKETIASSSFIKGAKWMQERYKWISVDDRLPENRSHVLAHTTNGGYTTTAEYKHGCWFKGLDRLYCVTHWQPLPLHPKD